MNIMSHEAVITGEEKKEKVVKIHYEVTVDGEKIGIPEADGETRTGHFDVSYEIYKDNDRVDKHLKTWAQQEIEKVKEQYQPSEPAEGRKVEL